MPWFFEEKSREKITVFCLFTVVLVRLRWYIIGVSFYVAGNVKEKLYDEWSKTVFSGRNIRGR